LKSNLYLADIQRVKQSFKNRILSGAFKYFVETLYGCVGEFWSGIFCDIPRVKSSKMFREITAWFER